MRIKLIQVDGATPMQDVFELIVVDAHAPCGLLEWQAFAYDQAHRSPIQCPLGSLVVAHSCRSIPPRTNLVRCEPQNNRRKYLRHTSDTQTTHGIVPRDRAEN